MIKPSRKQLRETFLEVLYQLGRISEDEIESYLNDETFNPIDSDFVTTTDSINDTVRDVIASYIISESNIPIHEYKLPTKMRLIK